MTFCFEIETVDSIGHDRFLDLMCLRSVRIIIDHSCGGLVRLFCSHTIFVDTDALVDMLKACIGNVEIRSCNAVNSTIDLWQKLK